MIRIVDQEFEDEEGNKCLRVTTNQTFDHTVVEGLLASLLDEVNAVARDLFNNFHDERARPNIERWIESAYHTVRYTVHNANEVLDGYKLDRLRPKHRDFRVLTREFEKRLSQNNPLAEGGVFSDSQFGHDLVGFLTAAHTCLLEQTKRDERRRVKRDYKAGKRVIG